MVDRCAEQDRWPDEEPIARHSEMGDHDRVHCARLPPWTGGGVLGTSSFASAERNGSRRGARGNLSSSMRRRIAAVTAACSSSVRSIVGMTGAWLGQQLVQVVVEPQSAAARQRDFFRAWNPLSRFSLQLSEERLGVCLGSQIRSSQSMAWRLFSYPWLNYHGQKV
jgi:hypothetical protein